jgi:hypothetical protein
VRDQTGIIKGSIAALNSGDISAGGTTITATNDTTIRSIAITYMKIIVITQASDTGIKLIFTADTNTPLKAIPTEIICN